MRDLLQPMHLLVIAVVFLIFFGGKKIPELAKGLGEGIRNFKGAMREDTPAVKDDDKKPS
jgi:sec-independent protein translocase protein TatA